MASGRTIINFLASIGIALSFYALYVEYKSSLDSSYVAMCDISEKMACSKVFSSPYGRVFKYHGLSWLDAPNALFGVLFYLMLLGFNAYSGNGRLVVNTMLLLAVLSLLLSAYLGYVLYFILDDFCVVCISTYMVNIGLFIHIARLSPYGQINNNRNGGDSNVSNSINNSHHSNNKGKKKR